MIARRYSRHALRAMRASQWRALVPASALLAILQGQKTGLRRVIGSQY